ncbi:hypothetical protein POTOM_060258 (mitochondrion) [Populus tomentosa]|uniref:GDSL esterase/lipase n=1 Tax=Populus tomentosa TaxID=118781 RepID=A0A8X7XR54_POPTO|nr:hypothetical protein POTOM_060258 [Populus tomentosa]
MFASTEALEFTRAFQISARPEKFRMPEFYAMLLFRLIRYLTLSDFTVDVHAADGWRDQTVSCAIRSPFPLLVWGEQPLKRQRTRSIVEAGPCPASCLPGLSRFEPGLVTLRLGLPFVPSYLGQMGTVEDMTKGVNYASAGAGVIFSSGSELGQRISFTQQIQQFTDTLQSFILNMGEAAANELISNSVFYVSIGVNDYIHYYLRNVSNIQNLYLPWSFNQFVAAAGNKGDFSSFLLRIFCCNLYNMNVRKVILMGLPPIGCAPYYLWRYNSKNGECIEEINDMILEYNFVMRYMIEELGLELPDAKITFCDMYEGSMDIIKNHELYGFNVTTDACCGLGKYKGWIMCFASEIACSNATNPVGSIPSN